jgi:hypothetical protein
MVLKPEKEEEEKDFQFLGVNAGIVLMDRSPIYPTSIIVIPSLLMCNLCRRSSLMT